VRGESVRRLTAVAPGSSPDAALAAPVLALVLGAAGRTDDCVAAATLFGPRFVGRPARGAKRFRVVSRWRLLSESTELLLDRYTSGPTAGSSSPHSPQYR